MRMDVNEKLRQNLQRLMSEKDINAPEVARRSGLNRRMVYDIIEGRSQSPKVETVFKIADAMGVHPGELLGFEPRVELHPALADLIQQYPPDEQELLAKALAALRPFAGKAQ
jgi:transcriptional regulator with XRE-family HTH domain